MIEIRCDGCGAIMKSHDLRYTVTIDVRAAYDQMEVGLADLVRDHRAEMKALIERMQHREVQELEDQVYKNLKLDLCPGCQKAFIQSPLRFHPEGAPNNDAPVNIDAFLRSLGYGAAEDSDN